MTQRELAERLGTTDKTISRWESGVQIPDAETVPALAHIFDVSIGELYGEDRHSVVGETSAPEAEQNLPSYPAADRRVIIRVWVAATVGAALLLLGAIALCLNNVYTMSIDKVGYLYFFGNKSGRVLGIILFGSGCLSALVALTAYKLWYRKPSRCNPRYTDTDASLNVSALIVFCALLLFILPRFLGFAVTARYVVILYAAAFFTNLVLTLQRRGFARRYSIRVSTVVTVISWTLGGLSLAALLICLDLHVFELMESLAVFSDVGFSDSTALSIAMQSMYAMTLDHWFGGAYYYFLLTTSVPLTAMLLLNAIELKVRTRRLRMQHPTEVVKQPKGKFFILRAVLVPIILAALVGIVWGILSLSGILHHYETVEVTTDSMSPTLHSGESVSFCTDVDKELLWQWDVILFDDPDVGQMIGRITRVNTNRDSDFRATSYVVQQDNPDVYDKRLVYPQDVIGVWQDAPRPGSSDDEETGQYGSVTDRGVSYY